MFSVFRSHNVGNFPSDLRQAVGSVSRESSIISDLSLACVELVLCLI